MIKTVANEVLAQSITVAVVLVTDVRSISASSSMLSLEIINVYIDLSSVCVQYNATYITIVKIIQN